MNDEAIVDLYWQRKETAISETENKYGKYLTKIAYNILADFEDSKESVNDTYLKAWNSMPPQKPNILSTYLGKITRQISIDIFRKRNRKKRHNSEYGISLSEIEDCVPDNNSPENKIELQLLADMISTYLRGISEEANNVFLGRYYFMDSIHEIAVNYNMSESKVKSMLHRTRLGLKDYLEKEGFTV